MKKLISGLSLGIVTLLWAVAGMAATVTVTPDSATVAAGDYIHLTVKRHRLPRRRRDDRRDGWVVHLHL